jgi:hypothetical protein
MRNGYGSRSSNLDAHTNFAPDWLGAMPVGMACLKEWNRRSPASLVGTTATTTGASNALSRLVGILSNRLPKSFEGCALPSPQRSTRWQPALAALATQVAQFMRQGVDVTQHSWSPQGASGPACRLHCNLCSSGWAGTITATKTLASGGQPYFTQTATFYVGGTSQNPNLFLAEWTAVGSGKYTDANGNTKEWELNADAAGQCVPLAAHHACVQALPQGNVIVFTEVNTTVEVDNAYQLTQTPSGGQSSTMPFSVWEDMINPLNITTPLTDTTAEGQATQTTNCQLPPQNVGNSCTLLWEWHLFKQ